MSKVFIGVGHGGSDPGAVGYIKEKDGALVVATACKDYLIANGVDVLMSRYIDEDESLNEKIKKGHLDVILFLIILILMLRFMFLIIHLLKME